jgi:hypothetical protein
MGFCSVIGGPFNKFAFGNAIFENILGIADAAFAGIGNQGHAHVVFFIKPANADATSRFMVNGILPGGIGVVVVPLKIDQGKAFHLMSSPENQAPQPWQ